MKILFKSKEEISKDGIKAHGKYYYFTETILIDEKLKFFSKFKILIHELGHHFIWKIFPKRWQRNLQYSWEIIELYTDLNWYKHSKGRKHYISKLPEYYDKLEVACFRKIK